MKTGVKAKTIGVLGGMGPESTVLFFQRVVELTPARVDQEHIPMLIYNNPLVPDRTKAIQGNGESPLDALKSGISILEKGGAEFICIPCNTAHYYYDELRNHANIPIINLIEIVVRKTIDTIKTKSSLKKVGLLATKGTIDSGLYQTAFQKSGLEIVTPEEWELNDLQTVIHGLKNKSQEVESTRSFAQKLIELGSQAIILGCTEFSLVAAELSLNVPIIDSVEVLAQEAVKQAFEPI